MTPQTAKTTPNLTRTWFSRTNQPTPPEFGKGLAELLPAALAWPTSPLVWQLPNFALVNAAIGGGR